MLRKLRTPPRPGKQVSSTPAPAELDMEHALLGLLLYGNDIIARLPSTTGRLPLHRDQELAAKRAISSDRWAVALEWRPSARIELNACLGVKRSLAAFDPIWISYIWFGKGSLLKR